MSSSGKRTIGKPSKGESSKRARAESSQIMSESHALPVREITTTLTADVIDLLTKLTESDDITNQPKYPVVLGSRAAAYWLPSFRPFADWDIVATPLQALNMVRDLNTYGNKLTISFLRQPLDGSLIKRKPMTPEVQEKVASLPTHLCKITGEVKNTFKFEIEITPISGGSIDVSSSSGKIMTLSNDDDNSRHTLLTFPIGPNQGIQCIAASVDMLETIKMSHINWPGYFHKHIADIHSLRALIYVDPTSSVNMGIHADKSKPLTSPIRTQDLEDLLLTRTVETEAFRGTPGAHINLNVSNEDFLERDDDLFVTRHIPHDDIHNLVKYGDAPIYDQLKTDRSMAMVSRQLFEKAPYDIQIKCVKEESMVIALERYLLPKYTLDPNNAYSSALIRICTSLTKGWFRQFAVDNYPRLAICDKNLLSIRDEILIKHPLPPRVRGDPSEILQKYIQNLDDLNIVQKLIPRTKAITAREMMSYANGSVPFGMNTGLVGPNAYHHSSWYERDYGERFNYSQESDEKYWIIDSTTPIIVAFFSSSNLQGASCDSTCHFTSAIYISPLRENMHSEKDIKSTCSPTIQLNVDSHISPGSWGGEEARGGREVTNQPVEEHLPLIDIPGLTSDLFMMFIVALVQPSMFSNGDTPLRNAVNKAKANGSIPVSQNHLWFDLWKYRSKI